MTSIVRHGSYRLETLFDIIQHSYGAKNCEDPVQGYAEALEIKNPPLGKPHFVLYWYMHNGENFFLEFSSLKACQAGFKEMCRDGTSHWKESIPKITGFIRIVDCGKRLPWFYSTTTLSPLGDFAPETTTPTDNNQLSLPLPVQFFFPHSRTPHLLQNFLQPMINPECKIINKNNPDLSGLFFNIYFLV